MNSYSGRYAELYDIFYKDKPYAEEAAFVHYCLQKFGKQPTRSVLELACGTGSHAIELEKFGYSIFATDSSDSMLAVARQKVRSLSSQVEFHNQDMRSLNLKERPFDAAICLFDSIGYVVTNEALMQTLQGINRYLHADGLLIFEFLNAGAMLCRYEPVRVRRWITEKGEVVRISETTLDHSRQACEVSYSIFELNNDGTYSQSKETHMVRYFLIQEMAAILEGNGFIPLKWFAGFSTREDITENTWHIVAVARKW
jgi:ubiquinone/menaquinone biosynthesis C-methylase UbiE